MNEPDDLTVWIQRLREGDQQAAHVIWDACHDRLLRLAQRRLSQAPSRGADEEDIALSALKSFMVRARNGQFDDVEGSEEMWKLLFTITVRKAVQHIRRQTAAKRNREISESILERHQGGEREQGIDGFADIQQLRPCEIMEQIEAHDELNKTLAALDDNLRVVAQYKLDGLSNQQIALACKRSERTIERRLHLIREIWRAAITEPDTT